jgi:L-aspartate oxidase
VKDLVELGVQFDADRHGDLALGLEGGHSRRRIIHAGGSATGRRILRGLSARVVEEERITVLEGTRAAAILQHGGVRLKDGSDVQAKATILATGGAAALYSRTTNPPGSFGSGLLLARQAGAMLADLEFTQFHPTAVLGLPGKEGFLISEAVRGEGATLHDATGERFVNELDPRDAVARAIFNTLRRTGARSVGLDMTMVDPGRFPNIVAALQEAGLDPARERVPVAPASHFVMGGIVTDLDGRATGVERLYAVGECACTGLHGANRLASNSLSECFVFGRRAALKALDEAAPGDPEPYAGEPISAPTRETRQAVWALAGLERRAEDLERLSEDPHPLARLVAVSALAREETRGSHARAEFPERNMALDAHHTIVDAGSETPRFEVWPS